MLYSLETNGTLGELINKTQLEKLFPNSIFPKDPTHAQVQGIGYVAVDTVATDLVQTATMQYSFTAVKQPDGSYKRVVSLVAVDPDKVQSRVDFKRKKNLDLINHRILVATKYLNSGELLQRDEWARQRDALMAITSDLSDPFLLAIPELPTNLALDTSLTGVKKFKIEQLKAYTNKMLASRPRVDSTLGFFVDGGAQDLSNFEQGKALGVLLLKDADNVMRTITAPDWDIILNAIRTTGLSILNNKWTKEVAIDTCTTEAEVSAISIEM